MAVAGHHQIVRGHLYEPLFRLIYLLETAGVLSGLEHSVLAPSPAEDTSLLRELRALISYDDPATASGLPFFSRDVLRFTASTYGVDAHLVKATRAVTEAVAEGGAHSVEGAESIAWIIAVRHPLGSSGTSMHSTDCPTPLSLVARLAWL